MSELTIKPRFSETDAMSHIGNTILPVWLEDARTPIFEKLQPGVNIEEWAFIVAHIDIDYLLQIHYGAEVTIKVFVSKIGTKSFTVFHEVRQSGRLCATGTAVIVHYDYDSGATDSLNSEHKEALKEFMRE